MQATDIAGRAFKNATAICLARVIGNDGVNLVIADISAIEYTAYLLSQSDPDAWSAITGHTAVSLTPADALFDTLQKDALWGTTDNTGYNFLHQPDVSTDEIFASAGTRVLIEYRLTPTDSGQVIVFRFLISVI